jgi:hypothetical protein
MADEFAKGFGIFVTAGFGWMVLAGWFNTPSFDSVQLLSPNPENVGALGSLALVLKDALFWFAILGALTFWVIIPLIEQTREALAESD